MSNDRELGDKSARIEMLESEISKARVKLHDHANKLTTVSNWIEVFRLQLLDARLKHVEHWQQRVIGAIIVIAAIAGTVGGLLVKLFSD